MRRLYPPLTPEHEHESHYGLGFGRLHIRDFAAVAGVPAYGGTEGPPLVRN